MGQTENTEEGCESMGMHKLNDSQGGKATFIVDIQHQQNGTWQGKVTWADNGRKETFRSALELLKLMDGAINEENSEIADSSTL